ncbi:hypothetical protein D1007_06545 [Hordeum vulgare]|nr:hypothetical protein D1007_06545 [Hordeum vulgare]
MLCNSDHSMLQELWRCDEDTQVKVVTFMWEWWNICNKANVGEAAPKPQVVFHRVEKLLIEFLGLQNLNKPPMPQDVHRWSKPPMHSSESVACLATVDGAIRIGANQIIFEFDSAILVHGLKSNEYDKATIGVLVKEARSQCIINFDSYAFSFCRRTCNSIAYEHAKLGVHSESYDSFWEAPAPIAL